jgi:ribosomal protein L37E
MATDRKIMLKAWEKRANTNWKIKSAPIAVLIGIGCPVCGHACSFDTKKMKCSKCGWSWRDEYDGKTKVAKKHKRKH